MNPKARSEKLAVREANGEAVVYDLASGKVHALNGMACFVFKHCDGRTDSRRLAELAARQFGLADASAAVELALEQLSQRGLLCEPVARADAERRASRRAMLKKLATCAAVPLVVSLTAPRAQAQVSPRIPAIACESRAQFHNLIACNGLQNGSTCNRAVCDSNSNFLTGFPGVCQNGTCVAVTS
jgi:PqqD family protein of HPr-rel-A system